MKTINKSYKFRIYPTKQQEVLLEKHFGCSRFVFNHYLNKRIESYKTNKTSFNFIDDCKDLTNLKKQEEFKWLKEVNCQSLHSAIKNLDTAYKSFFKKQNKYPKFKSKKYSKLSFTVPQYTKIVDSKLIILKFLSGIKINLHTKINNEDICFTTISKSPTGKYYASITCEEKYIPKQKTGKSVGIDLGLKTFVVTSNGETYKNNKYTKKYEIKLKRAQQHLSRKQKGSNSYEKQRRKVAIIHEKIYNSRNDNLHKVSNELITNYDIICVEDLKAKNMIKNKKLSKHIQDASWGTFVSYLNYKASWNDKQIIKINQYFPSSKTCNSCGFINNDLKLSDREWICSNCTTKHDRDHNASKNILQEGLRIYNSAGTVENTGGDQIRLLREQKHKSMKPEVQLTKIN